MSDQGEKRPWWPHALIAIVGILCVYGLTSDARRHGYRLLSHLASGDWEIVSDRPYIESEIRKNYEGLDWAVTFVAGSGHSFDLDERFRSQTILEIGQASLAESAALRLNAGLLQSSYGALLADALSDLADEEAGVKAQTLSNLAARFRRSVLAGSGIELSDVNTAQALLAQKPRTDVLRQALAEYEKFSRSLSLDHPAFVVDTVPSFDAEEAWEGATVLQQKGRCVGRILSLGNTEVQAEANVTIFPRLINVTLTRRWLSDAFLDHAASHASDRTRHHFTDEGDLRLIPASMWIQMPSHVTIAPIDQKDRTLIDQWARDGTCCFAACETEAFRMHPSSIHLMENRQYRGKRADLPPLLYAIASRRRQPL